MSTLDCKNQVSTLPRDALLKLNGFNSSNIDFVGRVIAGESVTSVANQVPVVTPNGTPTRGVTGPQNMYMEWKRTMKC